MSRAARRALAALGVLVWLTAAAAAAIPSPVGIWVTQGGDGLIAIAPCAEGLCGRIVGYVVESATQPPPRDWRGRPECGLTIIPDARFAGEVWEGHIIDPRNGDAYHARFHVDEDGALKLRGYLGIPLLGQTQTWTRFTGLPPPDCRMARLGTPEQQRPPGRGKGG